MEKEFVELLSDPAYLHWLAQKNLFEDERFVRYLAYLQYWRQPTYAKCIKHVHCLRFLELFQVNSISLFINSLKNNFELILLQDETFRKKLKEPSFVEMIHNNQYFHWCYAKTNEFQHKYQIKDDVKNSEEIQQNNADNDVQMKE